LEDRDRIANEARRGAANWLLGFFFFFFFRFIRSIVMGFIVLVLPLLSFGVAGGGS
jgi:hypothetical protein